MKFVHGTEAEHKATYERTKSYNPEGFRVWTGDIKHNVYLQENLDYMTHNELATITIDDSDEQESFFVITFTKGA